MRWFLTINIYHSSSSSFLQIADLLHSKAKHKKASQNGVFLDPNHSYFILVDDQKAKFGADVKLRGSLEKEMSASWKVPDLEKGKQIAYNSSGR